jgi:ATP-binding cassette subfamily C (CFTR/MRP) protein 3
MVPLVERGLRRPLEDTDLLPLNRSEDTRHWAERFAAELPRLASGRHPVFGTFWSLFRRDYALVIALALLSVGTALLVPAFIRRIVDFLAEPAIPLSTGLAAAFGVLACGLFSNITLHHVFHKTLKLGMRYRAALVVTIYRKSMRLTPAARRASSTGEIVNLMSTDAANVYNVAPMLHQLVVMPVQLVAASVFLYALLGVSSLAGLAVMGLMLPLSARMAKRVMTARTRLVTYSDARVGLLSEILSGIRVIKYYAWEKSFLAKVAAVRSQEERELLRVALLSTLSSVLFLATPIFVGVVTFSTHLLMGLPLRAPEVFAALAVFGILRPVMSQLPFVFSSFVNALVAEKRIMVFLAQPEIPPRVEDTALAPGAARLEGFHASWNLDEGVDTLSGISVEFRPGELVAIVGEVGAGKSSLLSALLGDLGSTSGTCATRGMLAYVPQHAWIVNATLRENVVFGRAFDKGRYLAVLEACRLGDDLRRLPAGDATEIGERGVNLSGGQKQRVCLARALYGEADIYLLDDTLSALDNHVGSEVFQACLRERLAGRTRVLVTHRLEYAREADRVIVMAGGRVVEQGPVSELLAARGVFHGALSQYGFTDAAEDARQPSPPAPPVPSSAPSPFVESVETLESVESAKPETLAAHLHDEDARQKEKGRLVVDEERASGTVRGDLYAMYLALLSPRGHVSLLLAAFAVREILAASADGWLGWGSASGQSFGGGIAIFIVGFALLGLVATAATFLRSWLTWRGGVRAALALHDRLLNGVVHAPVSFFDSTPTGRILNRFGKDTEAIDQYLPNTYLDALGCLFTILTTLLVVVGATPWTLVAVVPLSLVYFRAQRRFRASNREVKKLENISRSPLYAHFSETLSGVAVIRAFRSEERFTDESIHRFLGNQRSFYTMISLNRWLGTRLELIGALVAFAASAGAVLARGQVSPALAGLSVTYAFLVTGALNWAVRMLSEIESSMNSVERVVHYAGVPSERRLGLEPPASWPEHGEIEFRSFTLRYRADFEPVLKEFSLRVAPGETIGIVGRTGAGKSTLYAALFRFVEASEGSVIIDGIDVADVSLAALRSRLAIIPQDPVLFAGTLRRNLDPFDEHSDAEIHDALAKAGLAHLASPAAGGLDAPVEEGGANRSVGERQLLCLARALLRRVRILLMDEATANVDFRTDALIHKAVKAHFSQCTVLIIAHRLRTVLSCHRVAVLEAGRVVELGDPSELLSRPHGIFRALAQDSSSAAGLGRSLDAMSTGQQVSSYTLGSAGAAAEAAL